MPICTVPSPVWENSLTSVRRRNARWRHSRRSRWVNSTYSPSNDWFARVGAESIRIVSRCRRRTRGISRRGMHDMEEKSTKGLLVTPNSPWASMGEGPGTLTTVVGRLCSIPPATAVCGEMSAASALNLGPMLHTHEQNVRIGSQFWTRSQDLAPGTRGGVSRTG